MLDIESVYRSWIEEVWNKGREEVIKDYFHLNGVASYPYFAENTQPIRGLENFRQFYRRIREIYSDIKFTVEEVAVEENMVTAFCMVSAKMSGTGSDKLAAAEDIKGTCLSRVTFSGGLIIEAWNNISLPEE